MYEIDTTDELTPPIHIRGYLIAELGKKEGIEEYEKVVNGYKAKIKRHKKGKTNEKYKCKLRDKVANDNFDWEF